MTTQRNRNPDPAGPPLELSFRAVVIGVLTIGGILLTLTGTPRGALLAGLGIVIFVVTAWRDSKPEGGHIHKSGEDGGF